MEHTIKYLEVELDSLENAWRENTQKLENVYISKMINIKKVLCNLKKISK